ncbi:GntR family transcriptional regulator, partial [Azospirillum argentinense]|uniref:GntR family transcriptional regulator n=1 Tax=Azospirillum argentinense TaxID=2970906 RepID=UPI003556DD5F
MNWHLVYRISNPSRFPLRGNESAAQTPSTGETPDHSGGGERGTGTPMQMMSFSVAPLDQGMSFKAKAYQALRQAITQMDIYGGPSEIRLDERQLCEALGVSRTPVREAMALLEQE